jgi:hypothetical protein
MLQSERIVSTQSIRRPIYSTTTAVQNDDRLARLPRCQTLFLGRLVRLVE